MLVREGANYRVVLENGIAHAVAWKRPDITSQEGADAAQEMATTLGGLAAEGAVTGAIFDLREAPPVAGPRTTGFLSEMLKAWEAAGKRVAVLHGLHPMQVMQVRRLLRENAPRMGAPFDDPAAARGWLAVR